MLLSSCHYITKTLFLQFPVTFSSFPLKPLSTAFSKPIRGTSLVVQWLRLCTFIVGRLGLIHDERTKILHACSEAKKKKKGQDSHNSFFKFLQAFTILSSKSFCYKILAHFAHKITSESETRFWDYQATLFGSWLTEKMAG